MRIQDIEAIPIEIPLKQDFGGSTYRVLKRCTVITRIRTDDGLVSEVYNGDNRDHSPEIVRIIRQELAPLVIGEEALQIERLWERMHSITDYVNFDASEGGGITEWRRVAALCAVYGARMAHHEEPQIALHMLAAVPHGSYVECFADPERDPIWAGLIANRPPIKNGIIEVPQAPGFGLVLDQAMIKKYRLD